MKTKKWLSIGLIIISILLVWLSLSSRGKTGNLSEVINPNLIELKKINTAIKLKKISQIEWQNKGEDWKTEIDQIKFEKEEVSSDKINMFLKIIGMEGGESKTENGMILFNNNGKSAYVDLENNSFHFNEDVNEASQIRGINKINSDEIVVLFKQNIKELSPGLEIKITDKSYKKLVFPRWVEAEEEEADIIELTANYLIKNMEMTSYFGPPIKANFLMNGKMISLLLKEPGQNLTAEGLEKLISFEELKKLDMDNFGVWEIENNLSDVPDLLRKVMVNKTGVKYIFDNKNSKILPYFFSEGSTIVDNKPVRITIIAPAAIK